MRKKYGREAVIDCSSVIDRPKERKKNDEKFYREQVIPLYNDLYLFLRAYVNDSEAAKDIAQITMERAWKKIYQLKKKESVKSWLFQIARNASSTYYTSKQTMIISNDYDPESHMKKISDVEADVLQMLLDKERVHLIMEAMDRIDPKFKTVLQLWALGDLTQKEIAEILDINYNTARIYVVRGLQALKKEYFKLEKGVSPDE